MTRFALIALIAFAAPLAAQHYTSPNSCGADPNPTLVPFSYPFFGQGMRTYNAEIHIPQNMPPTLDDAAVVWSHGGGTGGVDTMREWAEQTTTRCYISVSLGHIAIDPAVEANFCGAGGPGQPLADCPEALKAIFKATDISDMVARLEASYPDGIVIGVGGHSGGTSALMTVAGAIRDLDGARVGPGEAFQLEDPTPDAFIGLSPTGPNYAGFFGTTFENPEQSWEHIDRPFLTATSDGDNQCTAPNNPPPPGCPDKTTPWNRRAPHFYMPGTAQNADPKYRLYINDTDAWHTSFLRDTTHCWVSGGSLPQFKCAQIFRHLNSVVMAFLDAELRGGTLAQIYLNSNQIVTANPGFNVSWAQK